MIVRVVQLTFRPECIDDFIALFEERKDKIRGFRGCNYLELWQDKDKENVFFTYSKWDAEADLDHYRFSEFFKETWGMTKALFADKPNAWSVTVRSVVP
jgi:quinol monooxygenase YgiN